jgi:hypothetical protein
MSLSYTMVNAVAKEVCPQIFEVDRIAGAAYEDVESKEL